MSDSNDLKGDDYAMTKQVADANELTCRTFSESQLMERQYLETRKNNLESVTGVSNNYYACVSEPAGKSYKCINNKLLNPSFKLGVGADASSLNHNIYQCMRFCTPDGPLIGKNEPLADPELCLVETLPPNKSPLFEQKWKE